MAAPHLDVQVEQQKLRNFLTSLPAYLEEFVEDGGQDGYTFDFSLASLSDVERYVAVNQELLAWQNMSDLSKWQRLYTWCYLGETFRAAYGGQWRVSVEDPDSVHYGQWVIGDFDATGGEFDPLGTLQGYLLRGKPGAFRRALAAHVTTTPLDLSHLPEEE